MFPYSYVSILVWNEITPSPPYQIMGSVNDFNSAVRAVIRDVSFDNDVVVSVFEVNIRVLG